MKSFNLDKFETQKFTFVNLTQIDGKKLSISISQLSKKLKIFRTEMKNLQNLNGKGETPPKIFCLLNKLQLRYFHTEQQVSSHLSYKLSPIKLTHSTKNKKN